MLLIPPGSDTAFESGLAKVSSAEVFLPFRKFNGNKSKRYKPPIEAYEIARHFHPNWDRCGRFARQCHARNVQQIMGENLNSLTHFVVCWTPGALDVGGTAQALRIARAYSVPIFNLGDPENSERLRAHLESKAYL